MTLTLKNTEIMVSVLQRSCFKFRLLVRTVTPVGWSRSNHSNARLAEVGVFETPKLQGIYDTGQLFLHRIFGYRGVILFPQVSNVHDEDLNKNRNKRYGRVITRSRSPRNIVMVKSGNENNKTAIRKHTYYLVLVDLRNENDRIDVAQNLTYLLQQNGKVDRMCIPGLDYVGHEDILPYRSTEKKPIHNDFFDEFLQRDQETGNFSHKNNLTEWQRSHHHMMELTDVHIKTTEDIRITVMPFYIGVDKMVEEIYWWRYCIRIENVGEETVQLRSRTWKIFCSSGAVENFNARRVVGREPIFSKSLPAFQYSSHISLKSGTGHMWGTFTMEREDKTLFDVTIPSFSLKSQHHDIDVTNVK